MYTTHTYMYTRQHIIHTCFLTKYETHQTQCDAVRSGHVHVALQADNS